MEIGLRLKNVRKAKNLSQKEVALSIGMDPAQYSRVENGKSDAYFSTISKIAKAIGVDMSELFSSDEVFLDINSADKTLMEKLGYIDVLDDKEKEAFFTLLDALIAKKKLKDNLSALITVS